MVAFYESNIHGLVVYSAVLLMVCFCSLDLWFILEKASSYGAWVSIFVGGFIWFISVKLETRIDPTIYVTLASFVGMIVESLLRPNHVDIEKTPSP